MVREIVRIRSRNQLTLPAEICDRLELTEGSFIEVLLTEDGLIRIAPARLVSAFSPEGHAKIERALADGASGRSRGIRDPEAYARGLRRRAKAPQKKELAGADS